MDRKEFISALGFGASAMVALGCQSVDSAASALPDYHTTGSIANGNARNYFKL